MDITLKLNLCPVCDNDSWRIVYNGKIRDGMFGQLTAKPSEVVECTSCALQRLKEFVLDPEDYVNDDYRLKYNGTINDIDLLTIHDDEQASRIMLIGTKSLRGATVIDIGCGHGAFLDSIAGLATRTIGVEPFTALHASLSSRGHEVFTAIDPKIKHLVNTADLVTSFGVIEHLEDPLAHLIFGWSLVKPGGRFVLQTDNLDEILFNTQALNFREFFYRTAHNWYFTPTTTEQIARRAGMENSVVTTVHEFGFSNFLNWHKAGKPTGNHHPPPLGTDFESIFKSSIERCGRGSLITLVATKDES
jgi:2-polyprenyl-3-methyl-5-hydroxy-6-metoxy-1,4-benzoquinol methylase